jgi:hypothetical protein
MLFFVQGASGFVQLLKNYSACLWPIAVVFRSGVLAKLMSFKKLPQIVSQPSTRGRIQGQTSDPSKFLFLWLFGFHRSNSICASFHWINNRPEKVFQSPKESFSVMTNLGTFRGSSGTWWIWAISQLASTGWSLGCLATEAAFMAKATVTIKGKTAVSELLLQTEEC